MSQIKSKQTSSIFEEKEFLQVLGLTLKSSQMYRRSRWVACVGLDYSCDQGGRVGSRCYQNVNNEHSEKFYFPTELKTG